jgi:long-chain acyl-CoA synthetase
MRAVELLVDGVTEVVGVPAVFHAVLGAMERRGVDLHGGALRLSVCGGAPLSEHLQRRWADATGVELRQGYGLTEASPVCLFNRVDRPNLRGTLGYPYPGVEVAIFPPSDYTGRQASLADGDLPLPDGVAGEICVRGPNVFRTYLHGRDGGLPRRGSWLCTGDRGVRHPDGSVSFRGVLKPMFTRNGFNVYPRELECAVLELSGVQRVEVQAAPDPVKENDIVLRVAGRVTEADVRRWCERRLSAYKQPSVVEILER